jgi:serine protease AprX
MSKVRLVFVVSMLLIASAADTALAQSSNRKLGPLARAAAARPDFAQVILRAPNADALSQLLPAASAAGARFGRRLSIINGVVIQVPGNALQGLADNPLVEQISLDRAAFPTMERTAATIGVTAVRQQFGYDGAGIGVAVVDSGVTAWHDDLSSAGAGQRVDTFVDFVNGRQARYDDYGHGTHVAGIIAGNGFDSSGRRAGIAPGAHLVVLKTLDSTGAGRISDVIAALDYIHANRDALNIRVVNMSVGAAVYESYTTDPLTLATRQLVADGIVVVAAAGNAGKDSQGYTRYGRVAAPGNAPWVLTVGASSHMGTVDRDDDMMAGFSSRGPTRYDLAAKPDLVAPGVGIESLSDPLSAFYVSRAPYLLDGTVATGYRPYLSLSGTSMASPVVTGTVALMLQANPALTPNAVKAILQYTAEPYRGYDALTQGAGFLNAAGAVQLARAFADPSLPVDTANWGRQIIWANHRVSQRALGPSANAWSNDVIWGDSRVPGGALVEWGPSWGASCRDLLCSSLIWGSPSSPNVVWGNRCGGDDCQESWTRSTTGSQPVGTSDEDTVVWGNGDSDTVVWGNGDSETVVWGNEDGDTVVWGNSDEDTVVWGNSDEDTVVWGNSCGDTCTPMIWGPTAN